MKKLICTGFCGKNPESRANQQGETFVTFSLGVSVGTKDKPKTDWLEISCNDKLAEIVENYVTKGSKLLIEGFPSTDAYINKDGKAISTMRLRAYTIEFIGSKQEDKPSLNELDNNVPF